MDDEGDERALPHPARVLDCLLGGAAPGAADRAAAERAAPLWPRGGQDLPSAARTARRTLARMVRHQAAELGIRQFLDVGAGLPTQGNTHQVAHRAAPGVSVVYVDHDPAVLGQARDLLAAQPPSRTVYLHGDLEDPDRILRDAASVLDLSRPVGLLLFGVLQHLPDQEDPGGRVKAMVDALAPGSCLSFAHPGRHPQAGAEDEAYRQIDPYWPERTTRRDRPATAALCLPGLEPLGPGVVDLPDWPAGRACGGPRPSPVWCGIGHKIADAP
jgi:SAM-dependent methyltransferase